MFLNNPIVSFQWKFHLRNLACWHRDKIQCFQSNSNIYWYIFLNHTFSPVDCLSNKEISGKCWLKWESIFEILSIDTWNFISFTLSVSIHTMHCVQINWMSWLYPRQCLASDFNKKKFPTFCDWKNEQFVSIKWNWYLQCNAIRPDYVEHDVA